MSNKNFNKSLSFDKVLELLNKLTEYVVHVESGDVIEGFVVELNDKTKNYLCNLGVKINKINKDFIDMDEGWIDIISIWLDIQKHYNHDIYYTGDEFIVKDKEKQELLEVLEESFKYLQLIQTVPGHSGIPELINKVQKLIQKYEGDEDE